MAEENPVSRELPPPPAAPPGPPAEPAEPEDHSSGPLLLTPPDRPDMGCYLGLLGLLLGLLIIVAMLARAGGALIIPFLGMFLLLLATPLLNPAERKSEKAKWIGRAITFVVLSALLAAGFLYIRHLSERAPAEDVREH
jgi:hypothetical protein